MVDDMEVIEWHALYSYDSEMVSVTPIVQLFVV